MRIAMLAQFYPPAVGGEERFACDLSISLAARGHHVSVVTLWHEGLPEFEVDHGVFIHRVRGTMQRMSGLFSESDHRYAPPFPDPELLLALRNIIVKERPAIVHAHNWMSRSFTPLKTWSKAKFVMSLHDYSLVCVQKRLMRHNACCSGPGFTKCLECGIQFYGMAKGLPSTLSNMFWSERDKQAVDLFLPVSQAVVAGTQLDKHSIPYKIMPNFIPDHLDEVTDNAHPLLSQLPEGDFLLFVGDVSHDKGAETLLQAYTELHTKIPLVMIGRSFLPNLVDQLPPNVYMLGSWPHDAVMGAWRRCSIGLVPSIVAETFGIVALEAMYMGKPVIASRRGGLIDVVFDGETGLLVPPDNPQALRDAIQELLDDPARRAYMGCLAKQHVKEFQANVIVPRFEDVYQELLSTNVDEIQSPIYAGSR
jgi:glycosyltransferase involved in cell wall biosynthesis